MTVAKMKSKILAIIPARAGSKRLPGKNKKNLGSKPLIEWTFDFAHHIKEMADVIVSTNDLDIVKLANEKKINVPFVRPDEISGDRSTPYEYVTHAMNELEANGRIFSDIILLQPTSPFRDFDLLFNEIKLFSKQKHFQSMLAVKEISSTIYWSLTGDKNKVESVVDRRFLRERSQDLPMCFLPCGSLYMAKRDSFLKYESFFCDPIKPIIINEDKYLIDIDDMQDFSLAENFIKNLK